jgi:aminoglycoside phosphotransferase (APT) family kinase protein
MTLSPPASRLELLRAAGFDVSDVLGEGMEGLVAVLDEERVVKLWDRRDRADVERLRMFYDAVVAAGFGLPVPRILEVAEAAGRVVTVQQRLHGSAPAEPDATLVVEVLEALAAVPAHPGLAVLPVPDGEPPFDADARFTESLAALVERRAPLLGDLVDRGAVGRLAADLRWLTPVRPRLVHGDLGVPNLLVTDGRVTGLLDFGYVSTVGDPAFDAAVAAALHRMFTPEDAAGTAEIDALTSERFGYPPHRLETYRAAYGLITASCLVEHPGRHLTWCLELVSSRRG